MSGLGKSLSGLMPADQTFLSVAFLVGIQLEWAAWDWTSHLCAFKA